MHASAQPLVLRSSRAHQRTHSKTRPCTRTHDTHAYTHPAEEAARVAGTGQVDPSCTVPGEYRRSQHERTLSILGVWGTGRSTHLAPCLGRKVCLRCA